MDLIQLNIKGISYSQTQSGAYALILEEINGNKKLPIIIGSFEAQSIALALEKDIKAPRPITHDLLTTILKEYDVKVDNVIIHKLEDGVFYSNIETEDKMGTKKTIDSRTSDAIAIALRFGSPIYTTQEVMEKAGIFLDVENVSDTKSIEAIEPQEDISEQFESQVISDLLKDYSQLSLSDLQEELNKAVKNEDYEKAAQIRDELNKRQ